MKSMIAKVSFILIGGILSFGACAQSRCDGLGNRDGERARCEDDARRDRQREEDLATNRRERERDREEARNQRLADENERTLNNMRRNLERDEKERQGNWNRIFREILR